MTIESRLYHIRPENFSRFHRCDQTCLRCRTIEFLIATGVPEPFDPYDTECVIEQIAAELLTDEHRDAFGQFTDEVDPNVQHIVEVST